MDLQAIKRYIITFWCWGLSLIAYAQFDPQMGQYMYMQSSFNPAALAEGNMMKVYGAHRMQYIGINNAPMTTWVAFNSPFVIGKTNHAAGVKFLNDKFGLFTNQAVYAQYAYKHKIGKGFLSAGIDLGFINIGFKGDSVNLDMLSQADYFDRNDEAIPNGDKSGMTFDMALGLYYSTNTWWVGASYAHLTQPKVIWADQVETEFHLKGTMYIAGGYHFKLKNYKNWQLQPSAILSTDFRDWDIDLTLMCAYLDKYRWGLGYRIAGSVNILLNIDIIAGLQLGYSCELPTSKLLRESYGSHEIYLAYNFDILKPKRTNRYKSVRYL